MVAQARFAGLYGELTVDGQEELPVTFDRLGAGGWTQVSSIPYPEPDQAEYNAYLVPGDAEITGQAFLMTRGGEVRRCSGQDVFLDPVTTYSRIWYENAGSTSLQAIPSATVFQKVRMVTKCDADGRFRFKGVPAGRYYLRTQVRWEAPTRYGLEPQGGLVGTEIEVRSGASGEVILGDDALLAPVAF
jgi:hypothetical protein